MTQNVITSKSVVPRVLVFGIIISIGVVYLKNRYPVPIYQAVAGSRESAELPNADLRLWRVHLLLR
jgi:hypothetical protein